jgi:hypothetical protein
MTKRSASPVPTSSTKKKQKKVEEKKETKEFVAMKKFKSSKKGYVFRMGAQGLGYYIDIKPVVDKMKMEALMRSSQQGKRGNSSKNSRRKGGRRSH